VLPETDMEYFGRDGDRMQMLFNFQVNQHLFYALASADCRPLAKALSATRSRPATAQWGIFLRNHDELDLGRLTKAQRDQVFKAFGPDKDMQLYDRGLLPLRGEGGEPLLHNIVVRPLSSVRAQYCLLQITDVTLAVTRECVLRERQNARYHAIVDSAPDAIITVDDSCNIQFVNGAVDYVLGYSPFRATRPEARSAAGPGQSTTAGAEGYVGRSEDRSDDIGHRAIQERKVRLFRRFVGTVARRAARFRNDDLA
jgi:PAS domain-containing protein